MRSGCATSGGLLDNASGVEIESTGFVGLKLGTDVGSPTNSVAVTRMTSLWVKVEPGRFMVAKKQVLGAVRLSLPLRKVLVVDTDLAQEEKCFEVDAEENSVVL